MKSKFVQYYVEGEDDKKVVDTLKTKMGLIRPGKVQILNAVTEEITDLRLRALSSGTMVVFVFDTDAGSVQILRKNLKKLQACKAVSEVVTIPQVSKLEDELIRSCNIKQIKELLNSQSNDDFKSDVIRVSNFDAKLREHNFNMDCFWSSSPPPPYQNIENMAAKIKINPK